MGVDLVVLVLSSALVLTLGITAVSNRGSSAHNLYFFLTTLSIVLWMVTNYGANSIHAFTLLVNKLTFASVVTAAFFLTLFVLSFPKQSSGPPKVIKWVFCLATILVLAAVVSTDLIVKRYLETPTGTTIETGKGFWIFLAYFIPVMVGALSHLTLKRKVLSQGERKQVDLILFGVGLTFVAGLVMNLILPLLYDSTVFLTYTPYGTVFLVGAIFYAMIAHDLFELRTLGAGLLAFAINIALIAQIFVSNSTSEMVLKIGVELIVAIGSYSLVKNINKEISRREEVERLAKERIETLKELEQRNKNLAALQKVSKMVLNQIEMKPMIQAILDEIPKQFDNCTGALLNLVHGGHMAAYAISTNEFTKKVTSLVGDDLEKYSYPIKPGFNLLHDTLISKQIKESTKLSDFICPPITKPVAATIQTLVGIKYTLAVPLFAGKEPLGVMLFSYRVPKSELLEKDLDMAVAISDETSLAIQRAYAFQQLKDANEYLADLDKLKDEFISIASHELNTPLAAVEGYLSMILDENMGKVDDKARVYLTRAYDSSKRLAELILDLLNVSRIEQGRIKMKFAKTNLYDLAESVMHELQVKVDAKKLTLKLEGDRKRVPQTWCDPDRIREVIVNLVGNAIKYTEKGGIRMRISEDAGRIKFEVIDTGRGISAEGQKKLFQKFSQVKREIDEQKGTGLGLYISKNFVELHKGRIWVESEEDKGSDFIFELPLLTEPPEKIEGAILEGPLSAPQIERRNPLEIPTAIKESAKKN